MSGPSGYDPPDDDMLGSVVVLRIAGAVTTTRKGTIRSWINVVRRASIDDHRAIDRGHDGYFGSPDPGLQTGDQIVLLDQLAIDPIAPRAGLTWVNTTEDVIKRHEGGVVVTVGPVPAATETLSLVAVTPTDVFGKMTLTCLEPSVDVNDRGVFFRVGCQAGVA